MPQYYCDVKYKLRLMLNTDDICRHNDYLDEYKYRFISVIYSKYNIIYDVV